MAAIQPHSSCFEEHMLLSRLAGLRVSAGSCARLLGEDCTLNSPPIPIWLQVHPLTVVFKVIIPDQQPLVMQFLYLSALETVTVRAAETSQQQVLGNLYPEDTGLEMPSEAAQQTLADQGLDFGSDRLDRPYLLAFSTCLAHGCHCTN